MARAAISELCHLEPWVRFGDGCAFQSFSFIGKLPSQSTTLARMAQRDEWLEIGARCEVGVGAIVYGGCTLGDDCVIGDQANIREGVSLGDRCVVGVGTSILYEARIEDDVRIMGGSHITGGMRIGRGTFVGVGVVTCNDKRREIAAYEFVGANPPWVGAGCVIGSGAVILAGVRVGDGAVIGAGALVAADVPAGATVLSDKARVLAREEAFACA